jgi:hypothetical protein
MVEVALVEEQEEDQLQEDDGGGCTDEEDQDGEEEDELKPDAIDSDSNEPDKPYDPQVDSLSAQLRGIKTVKELFRMVQNGTIDLSPDYQRDFVVRCLRFGGRGVLADCRLPSTVDQGASARLHQLAAQEHAHSRAPLQHR